jgi:hypothetical protein
MPKCKEGENDVQLKRQDIGDSQTLHQNGSDCEDIFPK